MVGRRGAVAVVDQKPKRYRIPFWTPQGLGELVLSEAEYADWQKLSAEQQKDRVRLARLDCERQIKEPNPETRH